RLKAGEETPLLMAVRSSSPQEDLEGVSFAGGYVTTLGVTEDELVEAIRASFASCFDERVVLYKREHEFAVDDPRIAVIVQRQVSSDASGVAFSLNPANNCFDEVVINSNFGLGESVVSGMVTPDSFVVYKPSLEILERNSGEKGASIWVGPGGGTYTEESGRDHDISLSDEQVLTVASAAREIEELYGKPVDIEWTFAGDAFWLLQARPVTAYIPLPEAMITSPSEQKRLYLDASTCTQGMNEPLSVLGLEFMEEAQKSYLPAATQGSNEERVRSGFYVMLGGRMWLQLSNMIRAMGKGRVAALQGSADSLAGKIIENIDEEEYVPRKMDPLLRRTYFGMASGLLSSLRRLIWAYRKPGDYKKRYFEESGRFEENLRQLEPADLSLREHTELILQPLGAILREWTLPMTYATELARALIRRSFRDLPDIQELLPYLEACLPENVTIEMGLAMHRLAQYPEIRSVDSSEEFERRMADGDFSEEFTDAWRQFMKDFGFRCPLEVDAATPRPYEQPARFYRKLRAMVVESDEQTDPLASLEERRARREEAYEEALRVQKQRGARHARAFAHRYRVLMEFGGYREIHKHYLVMATAAFRRAALEMGRELHRRGRLDEPEQVFDLTLEDLAAADDHHDLRERAEENTRFLKRLKGVRHFPTIMDSRGKILKPPAEPAREGEFSGTAISAGVVRGRVKVLNSPDEKPLLLGDILVARATDPGWTPLFINAGGVVLELGGVLQHGALVAREYGKPCVAGIEGVVSALQDGWEVEVDGTQGVVRLLSES
ncbi:MAG: PEP/pyruvate-binding domain-containing protein, partial [Bacillota bacterium]